MFILPPGATAHIDASPPDPNDPRQYPDDGYPDVIADARKGYGCETRAEIEDHWLAQLEQAGKELHFDNREAVPYINRARWLFDCPACNAGNWCWDRLHLGCCMECGLMVKLMWPAPLVRSQAIRLLAVRPMLNCNWHPHKGEPVNCGKPHGLICNQCLSCENETYINEPSIEKNGLVVPIGLNVPEALAKYVDPKVA